MRGLPKHNTYTWRLGPAERFIMVSSSWTNFIPTATHPRSAKSMQYLILLYFTLVFSIASRVAFERKLGGFPGQQPGHAQCSTDYAKSQNQRFVCQAALSNQGNIFVFCADGMWTR